MYFCTDGYWSICGGRGSESGQGTNLTKYFCRDSVGDSLCVQAPGFLVHATHRLSCAMVGSVVRRCIAPGAARTRHLAAVWAARQVLLRGRILLQLVAYHLVAPHSILGCRSHFKKNLSIFKVGFYGIDIFREHTNMSILLL
jgi:hypothetical protein